MVHWRQMIGELAHKLASRARTGFVLLVTALILLSGLAQARERVTVGGYPFPPFVNDVAEDHPGITFDLIRLLNREQTAFDFQFIPTGTNRRYQAFRDREYDLILFESPTWGWEDKGLSYLVTKPWFTGGEVYITRQQQGRDQTWFDQVTDHNICGVVGYHYGFAGFESSPSILEDRFDIYLAKSPSVCLNMVRHGRSDISVVTRSWLRRQMAHYPELQDELLVSEKLDQEYQHRAILHPLSAVNIHDLNRWLQAIAARGDIDQLLAP